MDRLPHELIAEIGRVDSLGALIMSHTSKRLFEILHKSRVSIANIKTAPVIVARINSLTLITYLMEAEYNISEDQILSFARHNNIVALEYLYNNGMKMSANISFMGIIHCHTDVLDFAKVHNLSFDSIRYREMNILGDITNIIHWFDRANIEFDLNVLSVGACETGNIELFKRVNSRSDYDYCAMAIENGQPEMAEYLYSIGAGTNELSGLYHKFNDGRSREGVIKALKVMLKYNAITSCIGVESMAAETNDIKFFEEIIKIMGTMPEFIPDLVDINMCKYLHKRGGRFHHRMMYMAIARKDEELIKYYVDNMGPINEGILTRACGLDFELMKYVYSAAKDIKNIDYWQVIGPDSRRKIKYLYNICPNGNLFEVLCHYQWSDTIKWAISCGYKVIDKEYFFAAYGNVKIISYFYEIMAAELDHRAIFEAAVKCGSIGILNIVRDYGYIFNVPATFKLAVENSQVKVIKWMQSIGYALPYDILFDAISAESIMVIKYFIECGHKMPAIEILKEMIVDKPRVRALLLANKLI